MDTKLKRFSYHRITKITAVIILFISFGVFFTSFVGGSNKGIELMYAFKSDYISTEGRDELMNIQSSIGYFLSFDDKETIESDKFWNERLAHVYPEISFTDMENRKRITDLIIGDYQKELEEFNKNIHAYYYAKVEGKEISNCDYTKEQFETFNYYSINESQDISGPFMTDYYSNHDFKYDYIEYTIYIAFDNQYMDDQIESFNLKKADAIELATEVSILFAISMIMVIYLIVVSGKTLNGQIKLLWIDKIWTELTLTTLFFTIFITTLCLDNRYTFLETEKFINNNKSSATIIAGLYIVFLMGMFLSIVRKKRSKTFIKSSFIYINLNKVYKVIKRIKNKFSASIHNSLKYFSLSKQIFTIVIICNLSLFSLLASFNNNGRAALFIVLLLSLTIIELYLLNRFVIVPYVDQSNIKNEISLNKAMKAERLKTELITNVSHDLKTPLTAILNYSDLLLKENKDNEYAKIIYEKSQKLRTLTEDLFEVSKVQSGNIKVNNELLDVLELINQTLAETDEQTIDYRLKIKNVFINADGKLMSRVFENLIININKYALPNTRAYIEAGTIDHQTYISFKNIANYEMDFNPDEITERFSRGDSSRTEEGNGLGLAIAKSYTEACGGVFKINIDGDVFSVVLLF